MIIEHNVVLFAFNRMNSCFQGTVNPPSPTPFLLPEWHTAWLEPAVWASWWLAGATRQATGRQAGTARASDWEVRASRRQEAPADGNGEDVPTTSTSGSTSPNHS